MKNLPTVSVIIPCRNEENYIVQNINSILNQDYNGKIEVLVVDGMSTDKTRSLVNEFGNPAVKLIDNPHQFTPHAMNIGVDNSEGDFFVILGGHSYLDKQFIARNVTVLLSDSSIGCSGGQIQNIYENEEGEVISKAMASKFGVGNATFRVGGKPGFVDTVAFGMYRKEVHYEINKFDETLVRNQDDDYNFKLTKAGYKVFFDPEIISHYYVRGSYSKLYKQYFQYGYWKVYVNKKHKTVTSLRQLFPFFFVSSILGGILLSFLFALFTYLVSFVVIAYLFFALYFGKKSGKSFSEGMKIAFVFSILHTSYGLGYLKGIVQFVLLQKQPSDRSKKLTRN
ncbi:MAG: glycosyltransferase family 2 protein [Flavobacteriales bacterium]|jgi:glycosyltransferase involved in cell wall biosynthesis